MENRGNFFLLLCGHPVMDWMRFLSHANCVTSLKGIGSMTPTRNKYQLSLTNPHNPLHRGKRATNKGGRSV